MVSKHGLELAVHIITSHFGDLVGKVCRILLQKGSLTLQVLAKFTKLQQDQLKKCLLVLIQHNCVQAFTVETPDAPTQANAVQYTAIFDNILHRMRFSKFLAIVGECLDEQCEELLHGLLQHGRLTLESIINRAISNKNEGNTDVQDAHRANFVRLVNAHFVERCPIAQPGLEPIQASASSRKRGAKSFEETPTLEKRAVANAAPSESERFSVSVDTGKDINARSSHITSSVTSGGKVGDD